MTADDGRFLEDVRAESGFRQLLESHKAFRLEGDAPYLLIPMTYRKNVNMPFTIEVYCDQPSCRVECFVARRRHAPRETVRHEACRTIVRMFLCHKWKLVRARPPNPQVAHDYIVKYFGRLVRDNDEGYVDINLALNALEAAYIQLTGKVEMKKRFFPQMRKRLAERGHVIADCDVPLMPPGSQTTAASNRGWSAEGGRRPHSSKIQAGPTKSRVVLRVVDAARQRHEGIGIAM